MEEDSSQKWRQTFPMNAALVKILGGYGERWWQEL
jgi:hypothetical protein